MSDITETCGICGAVGGGVFDGMCERCEPKFMDAICTTPRP
jgi:hypothetical protein